jgi:hypothetical protein
MMKIPKLRAEIAAQDELARLLRRLSDGGHAFRRPDVLQRFVEIKAQLLIWLSKVWLSIFPNRDAGNANGDPSGDWRTPARRGFGIVFLTFVVFGGWAGLASIDGAVVAAGSIVVESDRKSVQHLEGGIVQSLMVRGDAHVEQGQVLLRLDPTQDRAREEMARSAVYSAIAEEARLLAEGLRSLCAACHGRPEAAVRGTPRRAKDRGFDP